MNTISRMLLSAAMAASTFLQPALGEDLDPRLENLAGSREDTVKLAKALSGGKVVTLRGHDANGQETLTAFDVPGGAMSWGEAQASLALAQKSLAKHGIRNPSAAELQAALNGGTVALNDGARVVMEGVLQKRSPAAPSAVSEARAQGLPIYSQVNEAVIRPSWWANYRPTQRRSDQIEHVTGVIVAGYLR